MTLIPACVRCVLVLLALSWLPATAAAEVIEFVIDPTRSRIEVAPGNEIFIPLGRPLFSVTIPAVAPTSGTGAMLPDGTTSNGLVTSLEGTIVLDLDDSFASIRIIGRRSSIRLGESGSWLPGPPSAPTTPTAGEIAVEFSDATTLLSGSAVLRDTTFSLDSGGVATPLTPGKTDVYTFSAGCSVPPCPSFSLEDAVADVETFAGGHERAGLRQSYTYRSPAGTIGTLRRLPGGLLELTVPFDLATTLSPSDIQSAIPTTIDLAYTGTIVAVPEPDSMALSLAAVAGLLGLLAWQKRRKLRRGAWLVAGVVGIACAGLPGSNLGTVNLQGSTTCSDQNIRTTKNNGSTVIGVATDPFCLLFGFFGTIDGSAFNYYPYTSFSSSDPWDRSLVVGVSLVAMETFSTELELHQETSYTATYAAQFDKGDTPQLYIRAKPFNYGVDTERFVSAQISIDYGIGSDLFSADNIFRYYPLNSLGGEIGMDVVVDSERITVGHGYQGVAVAFGVRGKTCTSNHQCRVLDPALPYCGPVGCHAGGDGEMCDHDVQCKGTLGYRCNSLGTCSRGVDGDMCSPDQADCDDGNSCDVMSLVCRLTF